ncbi:g11772 [Coccomyxa elongata]
MVDHFTVSNQTEFNARLWSRAAVDKQYNYKQTSAEARRSVPLVEGEPPGKNDGMKNIHLHFVQHWCCFEICQAEAQGREPNYSLVHTPPAAGTGQQEQANGAKLLEFFRHILHLFDGDAAPLYGINSQAEKAMLGFFEDLLAAQFADCPKELQSYAVLNAADRDSLKAALKQIGTRVRERVKCRDAFCETLGAALTEQEMLKGTREIRLLLRNVVDEELDRSAKSTLRGVSTERLLVHGFTVQTGGPEGQDKQRGKTARWELDGFMRHANLDLCAASKVADYMLVRFRDLPLQPALTSAEALLEFLGKEFFMRHSKKNGPQRYGEDTIDNVLRGGRKGSNCKGLEHRAGVQHVDGKLMHRIKHGAVRSHVDSLGSNEEAKRYAKHGGKVHEASYSNRTWVPKLAMAKVAGHRDGFVQLYRAGIWRARDPGRLRNYTDVILQDLVLWCDHPDMGADYRAATDRFPFLAAKDPQHADWLSFCDASKAKALALQTAEGAPQTPPMPPPVQRPPAVQQPPPVQELPVAATIHLVQVVPDALKAPPGGWTTAALYERYSKALKDGIPSLREIMVHQGHLGWARADKDRKDAQWMNKFWSRICCEVNTGKELQQALKDAQEEYIE